MSRAIRFSKAEMDAVENYAHVSLPLQSLLAKMKAAREPEERPSGMTVKAFLTALSTVFKPHQLVWSANDGSYAKMAVQLKQLQWTEEQVVALAKHVKSWWKRGPVNVHTLLAKGAEWMPSALAQPQEPESTAPAALAFGEDDA